MSDTMPDCNGWCRPDLSLYEGKCPVHGIRALMDALSTAQSVSCDCHPAQTELDETPIRR